MLVIAITAFLLLAAYSWIYGSMLLPAIHGKYQVKLIELKYELKILKDKKIDNPILIIYLNRIIDAFIYDLNQITFTDFLIHFIKLRKHDRSKINQVSQSFLTNKDIPKEVKNVYIRICAIIGKTFFFNSLIWLPYFLFTLPLILIVWMVLWLIGNFGESIIARAKDILNLFKSEVKIGDKLIEYDLDSSKIGNHNVMDAFTQ